MDHQSDFSCAEEKRLVRRENTLFFRRWLKHPVQLGTLAPISCSLARRVAALVQNSEGNLEDKVVVELGAGTGRLSRHLLRAGVKPHNYYAVELDSELVEFLKETLPGGTIIQGDATYLPDLLPSAVVGQVDVIVSVIPLMYLAQDCREAIYGASRSVLRQDASFFHVCYSPLSPFKNTPAIQSKRVVSKWVNLPPGFVWSFKDA